jgi:uncharacterized damage-inducible protein DinB
MPTSDTRAARIAALRILPDQLEAAFEGWTDAQLDFTPAPGEWSARQIVHHLADSHAASLFRIKLALVEYTPTITPYNQEQFALLPDYRLPMEASLLMLRGLHMHFVALFESLRDEEYARAFFHPEQGRNVSVDDALAYYAEHGTIHIAQIAMNRASGGW